MIPALHIGPYTITFRKIEARYWFTIFQGNLPLISRHEWTAHKATMKALDKLEKIIV